jgi:hypothetical protein
LCFSQGWFNRFLSRNEITIRVLTNNTQEAPEEYFEVIHQLSIKMSSNETFEWTLERFPDLRLATNIVENPRSLLATIFGTPLEDIPATLGPVATYDAVFDAAQHCVVSIEKAL